MGIRYNSPWLLAGGLLVTAVFGGVITWGQLKRNVEVPQEGRWGTEPVSLCSGDGIDSETFAAAVRLLSTHNLPVEAEVGPCDGDAAIHLVVSVADIDRIFPPSGTMDAVTAGGAYERSISGGVIFNCRVFLVEGNDLKAMVHETLHCLGYDHARNPPAGHIMNKDYARISLDDWRGIP